MASVLESIEKSMIAVAAGEQPGKREAFRPLPKMGAVVGGAHKIGAHRASGPAVISGTAHGARAAKAPLGATLKVGALRAIPKIAGIDPVMASHPSSNTSAVLGVSGRLVGVRKSAFGVEKSFLPNGRAVPIGAMRAVQRETLGGQLRLKHAQRVNPGGKVGTKQARKVQEAAKKPEARRQETAASVRSGIAMHSAAQKAAGTRKPFLLVGEEEGHRSAVTAHGALHVRTDAIPGQGAIAVNAGGRNKKARKGMILQERGPDFRRTMRNVAAGGKPTSSKDMLIHEHSHLAPKRSAWRLAQVASSPKRIGREEARAVHSVGKGPGTSDYSRISHAALAEGKPPAHPKTVDEMIAANETHPVTGQLGAARGRGRYAGGNAFARGYTGLERKLGTANQGKS